MEAESPQTSPTSTRLHPLRSKPSPHEPRPLRWRSGKETFKWSWGSPKASSRQSGGGRGIIPKKGNDSSEKGLYRVSYCGVKTAAWSTWRPASETIAPPKSALRASPSTAMGSPPASSSPFKTTSLNLHIGSNNSQTDGSRVPSQLQPTRYPLHRRDLCLPL